MRAKPRIASIEIALMMSLALSTVASAEDNRTFSLGYRFVEITGEELFANVCQGCHMPDAAGATGAGAYPSLVADSNLEAAGYPILIVVNGRRGMPPFGDMMTDGQVAAVVNYLRTHFGNSYSDVVTARDVRDARR
jgi:mono/diheme cytochrome c family protein